MSESERDYASAASVAGLAGEVEYLRRRVQPLDKLPARVQQLADVVNDTAAKVQQLSAQPRTAPPPSWLMAPADPDHVRDVLDELCGWMQQVFIRYADAAAALPDCWLWHPDVVEELLWLMHAWLAAYQGSKASTALVGDWHDRQRPGVVRRIKHAAGNCSLENHAPATARPDVPLTTAVEEVAGWWADHRDEAAPEPTDDQFAAVTRRRNLKGPRR